MATSDEIKQKILTGVDLTRPIFNAQDGVSFTRLEGGKVAVMIANGGEHLVGILDPGTWASSIAFVSLEGDTVSKFAEAEVFHGA